VKYLSRYLAKYVGRPGGTPRKQEEPTPEGLTKLTEPSLRPADPPPWPWDQAEAERLVARLREGLDRVERAVAVGKAPPARLAAMRTWLEVAEGYIRDRGLEAARGCDAMELLRGAVGSALALASHGPPPPVPPDPAHDAELCRWLTVYFNCENAWLEPPMKPDTPALCSR
jgi:hypothetical protein